MQDESFQHELPHGTSFWHQIHDLLKLAEYALMIMSQNQAIILAYIVSAEPSPTAGSESMELLSCWAMYMSKHENK